MLNKEILKEYLVRKCDRLAYAMSKKEYAFSLLKKIIEKKLVPQEDMDVAEEEEEDIDSLLDYMKLYPDAYDELKALLENAELDSAQQLIEEMKNYQEVSELSRRYFSLLYPHQCARADTHDLSLDGHELRNSTQIEANTQLLLANPHVKVIFEGQITYDGLLARWDVLIKEEKGYSWYEVKGSTSVYNPSADKDIIQPNRIKKPFLYDIAFQYEVYQRAGLPIHEINFLHLNKEFVSQVSTLTYPLDDSDCLLLFKEAKLIYDSNKKGKKLIPIKEYLDCLLYVGKEDYPVSNYILQLQNIEAYSSLPNQKLKYTCRKAGGCLLKEDCFPHAIQDSDHLFKLTCFNRLGGSYRTCSMLMDSGLERISDIPSDIVHDQYPEYKNGKRQIVNLQIEYAKKQRSEDWIDLAGIRALLEQEYTKFPLIFFDFETFSYPIPLVENTRPWERVCCQYSMHIVQKDYDVLQHDFSKGLGGGIQHQEFIGNPQKDRLINPELALIHTLQQQLSSANIDVENGQFTMVVYNKNFEKGELRRMASKYPAYANFLTLLNTRVVDLLDFFTSGYWYQPSFGGRVSLKVTQPEILKSQRVQDLYQGHYPAIVDSLNYKQGLIQNGSVALDVYQSLLRKVLLHRPVDEQHDAFIRALLAYCKIDSWGTVVLYDIIRRVGSKEETTWTSSI